MRAFLNALFAALLLAACTQPGPAVDPQRIADAADDFLAPKPSDLAATRDLVPVIAPGWTTQAQENEEISRVYHGTTPASNIRAEAALNARGMTGTAHFQRPGVTVEVDMTDLLYPSVHEMLDEKGWALLQGGRYILIDVSIYAKPGKAVFYPSSKGLVSDCGPGVKTDADHWPAYLRLQFHPELAADSAFARSNPDDHSFALLVDGDPHVVERCTLHLSRVVRLWSGDEIPDLAFKTIPGQHDTRTLLMRNETPTRKLATR